MNQNALVAAEGIVVPVACDFLSLVGVRQVVKTVKNVNALLHHPVQIHGVLPTFYDARARICRDALDALQGPLRRSRLAAHPFGHAPEGGAGAGQDDLRDGPRVERGRGLSADRRLARRRLGDERAGRNRASGGQLRGAREEDGSARGRDGARRAPACSMRTRCRASFPERSTRPILAAPARARKSEPKPAHYKVICISLYNADLERLDGLVDELKARGLTKANRSALIRVALDQLDLDKVPKGL